MCCTQLDGNAAPKKIAKNSPSGHHRTTLLGYIFATKACIDNQKKNLLNSNVSPTCPDNKVNFGPLAAEICLRVWGNPANFNRFRVLAALLHGTLVVNLSDVGAVTKPRRETRWNLLACPKFANRSQPLVGWSSTHCDACRGDKFDKFFPDCWYMLQLRRYSPTNLCNGAQTVNVWRIFASCVGLFSASHVQYIWYIWYLHSKFALRPHHV